MKSEPLCATPGCPKPSDPDWHRPICLHGTAGHHHHVVKRSQGGVDGDQVFICPECHDRIDNGTWSNAVLVLNGDRVYRIWDLKNETILEVPHEQQPHPAAKTHGPRGEDLGAGRPDAPLVPDVPGGRSLGADADSTGSLRQPVRVAPELAPPYWGKRIDYEAWATDLRAAAMMHRSMGWVVGYRVLYGEDVFGEEAWQVLDELGYAHETIANMVSVCRAFPPGSLRRDVPFSLAAVLAPLARENAQGAQEMAERAAAEGWSTRQLKEAVGPSVARPAVKRWSGTELRAGMEVFLDGSFIVSTPRHVIEQFILFMEEA